MRVPDCGEIIINAPPLPEQRQIAQILSTWDKAIVTTEKLIAASQQQKKALMQQLLTGKKRFAGFSEEWERYSLGNLVFIDKKSIGKSTPKDFSFRYISLSDVSAGVINNNLKVHQFMSAPSRARRMVQIGDILFSTVRPNLQGFSIISEAYSDCIASTGFSVLTPKQNVCGNYIYQCLFSYDITTQIDALVVGSNYPAINSSDVKELKIYCPNYPEQQKIAAVLTAADQEIDALQSKLAHLKQEKKALMQQLPHRQTSCCVGSRNVSLILSSEDKYVGVLTVTKAAVDLFTTTVKGEKRTCVETSPHKTITESIEQTKDGVVFPNRLGLTDVYDTDWHWLVHCVSVKRQKYLLVMD